MQSRRPARDLQNSDRFVEREHACAGEAALGVRFAAVRPHSPICRCEHFGPGISDASSSGLGDPCATARAGVMPVYGHPARRSVPRRCGSSAGSSATGTVTWRRGGNDRGWSRWCALRRNAARVRSPRGCTASGAAAARLRLGDPTGRLRPWLRARDSTKVCGEGLGLLGGARPSMASATAPRPLCRKQLRKRKSCSPRSTLRARR